MAAADAGAHDVLVRSGTPPAGVLLSNRVHQLVYQNAPENHVHQHHQQPLPFSAGY